MRLHMYPFPSDRFTYNASDKTFTAEASDLQDNHLQRIYDDACDVGLTIVSTKTGIAITYYMEAEYYREGELTHWVYLPLTEDVRKHPSAEGTSVTIFND